MEKIKRWQVYLIIALVVLTVYNILPTLFFYSNSLSKPISEKEALQTTASLTKRINSLEQQSIEWLYSYCKLLRVKPASISIETQNPAHILIRFASQSDANYFAQHLPRSGELIPFAPAQLSLYSLQSDSESGAIVTVQRKIPIHFDTAKNGEFFQFSQKFNAQEEPTPPYKNIVFDRLFEIAMTIGGASDQAQALLAAPGEIDDPQTEDFVASLAHSIVSFTKVFGEDSSIAKRYFASFTQTDVANKSSLVDSYLSILEQVQSKLSKEADLLAKEGAQKRAADAFLETAKQQRLEALQTKISSLSSASSIIRRNRAQFASGETPWSFSTLIDTLRNIDKSSTGKTSLPLGNRSSFFKEITIDWQADTIYLTLQNDLQSFLASLQEGNNKSSQLEQANQFLYNDVAALSRQTGEKIVPAQDRYLIAISELQNSKSFLVMRLASVAKPQLESVKESLLSRWNPQHPDLSSSNYPLIDFETYSSLSALQKKLGLVFYAPTIQSPFPPKGFKANSLYVIAKGLDKILEKVRSAPESESSKQFLQDFNHLRRLLQESGFFGYPASTTVFGTEFKGDFIFEAEDYFQSLLKASRENFTVHGTKRFAVLEFSNVEQRLLTLNKIDDRIHEDLLKWKDNYYSARIGLKGNRETDVPKPTQSPLWSNFKLSTVKYFRGDERKILRWGLDLSGGKTVQIELRDANNRMVTKESDISQAINELYERVNKMGVSEVGIRKEGNYITLDFPGSQNWSAAELVKASSMHFHVVNEKFSTQNPSLGEAVNRFLQEVWNEALVTGHKEIEEINAIAWKHFHGDSLDPDVVQPRSEAAKLLYDHGLRLASPLDNSVSSTFNDTYSAITMLRGESFTEWHGQAHPLLIVFKNFALEGSDLSDVHASFDPSKGNFLSFKVKSSYTNSAGQKSNPRADLFAWTSPFSKEKVLGTQNEAYSRGKGWRMAVILNGSVISAPTLDSPLSDSAMITGSFTQREVNALEADLKAGSLSFTPKILSEKNVSPELGSKERMLGIFATFISLLLVIGAMVSYYRFGGVVASAAVIFNLLIMWAVFQNIQATLTLAGLAGVILTMGIAVDANVLVFERIREEFALSGRIASAVHAGYRRAFSAIFDSNITTIIAALVLLQFNSGPIRGFALTLIIGILCSMITALFMTRIFFTSWVQNPKNKVLTMAHWIKAANFPFLKYGKTAMISALVIIAVGALFGVAKRHTLLGMDFTGGYAITLELKPDQKSNYRDAVEKALSAQGLSSQEYQVRELTPSNNIRLFLSHNLNEKSRPFYGMPLEVENQGLGFNYESNPRINWIVSSLDAAHLSLTQDSQERLDKNWTDVSGQISKTMRNYATIGLSVALFCILLYITFRFELKYAVSATICLLHDIAVCLALVAFLHFLGAPLQIDLTIVAALLTIAGYSLNDTIIVFDRIREDVKTERKKSFPEIIVHALNATLSRTLMTSTITLLVLLPLVFLGGSTLFGFALVMIFGVVFGTLSSLFIASPLMLYFHNRQLKKEDSQPSEIS